MTTAIPQPQLRVERLPDLRVAYVAHRGPYHGIGTAFSKLNQWGGPLGLFARPDVLTLGIYHDDPQTVLASDLRSEAAVSLPAGAAFDSSGVDGIRIIKTAGTWAMGRFEIGMQEFPQAWHAMFAAMAAQHPEWRAREGAPMEIYRNDPETHSERKFIIDIAVPVLAS